MATTTTTIATAVPVRAIVTHEATTEPPGPNFKIENLHLDTTLAPTDLLVKITATGICHTDIVQASAPGNEAMVLGHEGAGVVQAVGASVTKAKPGDLVMMSYMSCRQCIQCTASPPHYGHCTEFLTLNFGGITAPFTRPDTQDKVRASFFGQSSFAELAVVNETSVLNATALLDGPHELKDIAPLGCGLLTGYATVMNVARPTPQDRLLVSGLGGVGLSAIMAARLAGCAKVLAVDRVQSRLDFAKELGATHTINTAEVPLDKLAEEVGRITDGLGVSYAIDTTGVAPLMEANIGALTTGGELILLGVAPPDAVVHLKPFDLLCTAKTVRTCLMGDCDPAAVLPELIQHYKAGRFPFDRLIKHYTPDEFHTALHDMHTGQTVKPIIVWNP